MKYKSMAQMNAERKKKRKKEPYNAALAYHAMLKLLREADGRKAKNKI